MSVWRKQLSLILTVKNKNLQLPSLNLRFEAFLALSFVTLDPSSLSWMSMNGHLVMFSEVRGMTELNDGKPRKDKKVNPLSFLLEDTTNFSLYESGGIVTLVKQPKVLQFKSLKDALKDPREFLLSDISKFHRPPLLHLAFQALDKLIQEFGRFPVAGWEEDAGKVVVFAIAINERSMGEGKLEKIDKKILHHFSHGSRAVLNPMAAMFGGIVG